MHRTPAVEFRGVSKRFGATDAVRDVSFEIAPGEFFSLLGPSGCGKTGPAQQLAGVSRAGCSRGADDDAG